MLLSEINNKPSIDVSLGGFAEGQQVVRTFEEHPHDNRIYVVQEQFGNYYCGRTNVSSLHGGMSFMVNTTTLRPATVEESESHCRMVADSDLEVHVVCSL